MMNRLRLRDDTGIAMITAILVTMVVLSLSVVSFQLAGHDLEQSANDRRNVQAIHAAEAGLDRFLDYLAHSAPITNPATTMAPESLSTSPPASFAVSAVYYCTSDGTGPTYGTGSCISPTVPSSVLINAVGSSAGRSRTMNALVGLASNPGGYTLGGAAVYAGNTATWTGQAQITNSTGTELAANLYSNGDLDLKGGGTVYGTVEAQGSLNLSGTTDVKSMATSKGPLSISNNSIVRGDARSTASSLTSGGVVSGSAYYCTGSAPGGTVTGSTIQECPNPAGPPVQSFNQFSFVAADWQAKGYTVNTYTSCSSAQAFLSAIPTGNYVVRLTNSCGLTLPNITMRGNLAVITNGDLSGTGSTSISVPSTPNPPYTLSLMANVLNAPAVTGGPTCGNNAGISLAAGTTFPAGVDVLFYTPCDVRFTGNATAAIQGQIISGHDVKFASGSNITYKPIYIPGISPNGYSESLQYRREITN
jgi:hypothetical protein